MRKAVGYPVPKYNDPNDRRMIQIIKASGEARPRSVNILGVPFDGAVLGRRGAAEGPQAVREAMAAFSNYNVELDLGLDGARVYDLGDLVLGNDDVEKAHALVESEVVGDLTTDSLLVVLGGDNSISLPALRACSKKFGSLGLIVVDSHLDLRGKLGGKPTSGSSYGLALDELGNLDPRRVVELGVHGFLNSKAYFEKAQRKGITLIPAGDIVRKGPEASAKEAYGIASKGADAVYLSVDLDAVDLSYVSGVSAPSAGGISAEQLFRIVYEIAGQEKVKGADIVELAPSLDSSGRSQRVAATALMYLIGGFASRARKRTRRS
ncbi:MAG: agmatinase family protein [Thaumarchaeota archaeon]|nr:agmatinase family protein [Nitrososphaerota archaeon]